jgi:ATP-dependent RNA helicase RhlE
LRFDEFGFSSPVLQGVTDAGFETPTPIQEHALPFVLAGKDVVGLAETGTGKTAAFVLPILEKFHSIENQGKVRALILAPTRELAHQIHGEVEKLSAHTGITSTTIYITALKRGVDVVVACPGRLLDHMRQKNVSLREVEILVLDEADRMLDMGFIPDIRRIVRQVPKNRQTLLFSATMPEDIRRLIRDFMHKPETVQVGTRTTARTVTHGLYPVDKHLKYSLLRAILDRTETGSVIIFTRTKGRALDVAHELEADGYSSTVLMGDLSQAQRQQAMDGFRDGTYKILVATDIAARGIDVTQTSHVINYDIPENAEDYTHRTGRTGRASREGDAITLVSIPDDIEIVQNLEGQLDCELHLRELDDFDYDARPETVKRPGQGRSRRDRHKRTGGKKTSGYGKRKHPGNKHKASASQSQTEKKSGGARNKTRRPRKKKHSTTDV